MDFVPHSSSDWSEMLRQIGVPGMDDLLSKILPKDVKKCDYRLEPGLSEFETLQLMKSRAELNAHAESHDSFLGAGAYHHFIPSLVQYLVSRGEFCTAYTPYQPEASQGTLQAIFEFQSMIARLTGMDVANASLYDGASALAEAALMSLAAVKDKGRILVCQTVHPEYRQVVKTYLKAKAKEIVEIPRKNASTDLNHLEAELKKGAAAVLVSWPNFFGCLEDIETIGRLAHENGALLVMSTYPVALGLLRSPGSLGADICVGEGQSLGNGLQYGGPYFGFIACRKEHVRKMPGRLVGMTKDLDGKRGFVLTLQAREQHIRREKATSNICTNQSLNALMATVYMSVMGSEGLKELAHLNFKKAHYAAQLLAKLPGFSLPFAEPFFNEFVLRVPMRPEDLIRRMLPKKIIPGVILRPYYADLDDALLVCVTEMMSRSKIENFVKSLAEAAEGAVEHGKNRI